MSGGVAHESETHATCERVGQYSSMVSVAPRAPATRAAPRTGTATTPPMTARAADATLHSSAATSSGPDYLAAAPDARPQQKRAKPPDAFGTTATETESHECATVDGVNGIVGGKRHADAGTGSVFGTALNLAATAFGASILSLPYALHESGGWLTGLLLIVGTGALAALAANQLLSARADYVGESLPQAVGGGTARSAAAADTSTADITSGVGGSSGASARTAVSDASTPSRSSLSSPQPAATTTNTAVAARPIAYADIVRERLGRTAGRLAGALCSLCLIVAAVTYTVGIAESIPLLLGGSRSGTATSRAFQGLPRAAQLALVVLALFPATLARELSNFALSSLIAVLGCYAQMLAVALRSAPRTSAARALKTLPALGWRTAGVLRALPLISFVYAYHYVLADAIGELREPAMPRMKRTVGVTTAICTACYIPYSVSGLILVGGRSIGTNLLVSMRHARHLSMDGDDAQAWHNAVVLAIATWSIAGVLAFTYPLFLVPLRRQVEAASGMARASAALLMSCVVYVAALALPDLGVANAVAGGAIATVMFVFPGLMMVAVRGDKERWKMAAPGTPRRAERLWKRAYGVLGERVRRTRRAMLGIAMVLLGALLTAYGIGAAFTSAR